MRSWHRYISHHDVLCVTWTYRYTLHSSKGGRELNRHLESSLGDLDAILNPPYGTYRPPLLFMLIDGGIPLLPMETPYTTICLLFSLQLTVLQVNVFYHILCLIQFFLDFFLAPLLLLDPFRPRWCGPSTSRKVFRYSVSPKTSWRRFMISMLCLSLFQNDYISKQLDIFYIKPFFFYFLITAYSVWI